MDYNYLLQTRTGGKWDRIGAKRRSGIAVPLFSVYSANSTGIGEIPDLKLLIEWCKNVGFSILQLLPLNETGSDFSPYSSISTFALEPMYLSPANLADFETSRFQEQLNDLSNKFRRKFGRVNYAIKADKLKLLKNIFEYTKPDSKAFREYKESNSFWLRDYSLYRSIVDTRHGEGWGQWGDELSGRDPDAIQRFSEENTDKIEFFSWLQWQLFEQMADAKKFAAESGVLLMGDLPFLVSKESADVWSFRDYFKLNLSSGAPPDMYFALGQQWGMPAYNWEKIEADGYIYLNEKLKYAQNFYDLYRIDHFIGLFRVWTFKVTGGNISAAYDPPEEHRWEEHGRKIIDVMVKASSMLPCAEDLGTVPECSGRVLHEYGIPGVDFQRYTKNQTYFFNFKPPFDYRLSSVAVISTHDSAFFPQWWDLEAGTIDSKLFDILCTSGRKNIEPGHIKALRRILFTDDSLSMSRLRWKSEFGSFEKVAHVLNTLGVSSRAFLYPWSDTFGEKEKFLRYINFEQYGNEPSSPALSLKCLKKINESKSIFSIQMIQEYLALDDMLFPKLSKKNYRINRPGEVTRKNWSILLPIPLEKLTGLKINGLIREMNIDADRH